jgi:uncharacterized membrane protein YcaP (DUF421 family)
MFFDSWRELGRIALMSTILFVLIVVLLRVVGQQALAKMSGYDVVVTVTLGSIVASVVLTRSMTVSDAAVALISLIALQETTRWLQARWLPAHHSVRERPRVVLWDGALIENRLTKFSISADEVRAAVRKAGYGSLGAVRIVVLENDGEWSVVGKGSAMQDESAFYGLDIPDPSPRAPRAEPDIRAPSDRLP